jgi:O2-independent ubiquinone biosynthesis accessory factor UbiT
MSSALGAPSPARPRRARLPDIVGRALRPLPLFPLERILNLILKTVLARRPGLFARMGEQAGALFLIEAVDLPFFITLDSAPQNPAIHLSRERPHKGIRATVSAPILTHLKMLTGGLDGDALFFSREIGVSGDTAAVLALRNAVDDLDLSFARKLFERGRKP